MRRSLLLLVLAGAIPIVALGGTFGALTLQNERRAVEAQSRAHAKFLAALVDMTLRSNLEAVAMVAQSPALDGARLDEPRFRTLAARIRRYQPDWHSISIATAAGERLIDLPAPPGPAPRGRVAEPASLARAVATGRPQIGVVVADTGGARQFAVRAPVEAVGGPRLVVSALIPAAHLEQLLRAEALPAGWTASVIDAAGTATTVPHAPARARGAGPAPVEVWAPVAAARWSVKITTPAQAFTAPLRNAVLLLVAAALLCLLLLALLARMLWVELRQLRRQEEAQRHGQRMEALGRLTGGVAHDVNNLLTPIMVGLDLIRRRAADPRVTALVDAALASAERARLLVSRLLSFSRQQPLSPAPVELGALLDGMADLIEKSLTPAIALTVTVTPRPCGAVADPAQLELAILNLLINARDAMPAGGAVTVSVAPAAPGDAAGLAPGRYVAVTVSDTGQGMDAATLAQAVDPFFTTKPVDKGTGLGLSMVHGFAAQSGGALRLASAPGAGTRATILLPATDAPPLARAPAAPPVAPPATPVAAPGVAAAPAARARILLVDDDARVRTAIAEALTEHGHPLAEVGSVAEALAVLEGDDAIELVVTDLLMPDRPGTELVRIARARWPGVALLLVTGHAPDDVDLPADLAVLRKPFRRADLLAAVAAALAGAGRARPMIP
ncbi:ATP-binding protein [Sphingomonas sp. BK235]|uniref:ATP-binding protein n=1 Tax=Sphingomonas sp. BK235 TaxID=2512131 RepID=UPI00104E3A9C|nr:ATP-binding protein [Sphingomonas sp. BK235]TCP29652.1 signal transduction histidine kinase [Sphingomonas sp. BK235]